MKVRITRMYFDGMRRHREGSVIVISDRKYTKESEIPKTSRKKVGDYVEFSASCMEIVSARTPNVDVPRPTPGKSAPLTQPTAPPEAPSAPAAVEESAAVDSAQSLANQDVI